MSNPIFTWTPNLGASQSVKPIVHQTKFGEGYEARVAFGINTKPKVWSLQFSKASGEALAILGFLDTSGGVSAFTWVDPLGISNTYICREWSSMQTEFGVYQVTAKFEQIFEV
jgi:phage-related protein